MSEHVWQRWRALIYPLIIFAVNLRIVWRLFRTEYLEHRGSIEGAFISLESYIRRHWPYMDWFPLWYSGYPLANAYQPLLHYLTAAIGAVSGLRAAAAYHAVTALSYSLGAVAFYYLARVLMGERGPAFWSALVFSVFSPALLLLPL